MRQISIAVSANMNRDICKSTIARIIKKREDLLNSRDIDNPNRVRVKTKSKSEKNLKLEWPCEVDSANVLYLTEQ